MNLFFLVSLALGAAPSPHAGWNFSDLERVPVMAGGRIKPLLTYANEIVLYVSAKRSMPGWNSVELLTSWVTHPEAWNDSQMIRIGHRDVKRQLLLDESRIQFSPKELFGNTTVVQYFHAFQSHSTVRKAQSKPDIREKELERVLQSLSVFSNIVSGAAWPIVPSGPGQPWKTLAQDEQENARAQKTADVRVYDLFVALIRSYSDGQQAAFEKSARDLRAVLTERATGLRPGAFEAERAYETYRPLSWAWVLYLFAAIGFALVMVLPQKKQKALRAFAWGSVSLGLVLHVLAVATRILIGGRPPVSNMYESIIWVAFGVLMFALIVYRWEKLAHKQIVLLCAGSALASIMLIAADASPAFLDPGIHPLVPVLRSNAWLTIHVLVITLSYSAFALSLGLANATMLQFLRRAPLAVTEKLNQLTYRVMQIGVVMLAAGTILGGVWADYSWGRFWGWDPKETWALIALLAYIVILHARFVGWIRQFGFAAWTIIAFLTVLMAWYGVNFVLGAGLHSYGFSAGGQGWVAGYSLLQLGFVAYVAARRKRVKKA